MQPTSDFGALSQLTDEQRNAIVAFREQHGRNWKAKLGSLWLSPRSQGHLHVVRNTLGPEWLQSVREADFKAVAKAAENAVFSEPPYNPNDMDAAVAYSKLTTALFANGDHDEAYAHYMRDPNGGALADFSQTTKEQFIVSMYSLRDVQGNPIFPQPVGYQYKEFTVGHQAHLRDSGQWATISHIFEFDDKPYIEMNFDAPVSSYVDGDGRRQVVTHLPGTPRHDGGRNDCKLLVSASEVDQTRPAIQPEQAFIFANEADGAFLESLGASLGKYDTQKGGFPAKLEVDAIKRLAEFEADFTIAFPSADASQAPRAVHHVEGANRTAGLSLPEPF